MCDECRRLKTPKMTDLDDTSSKCRRRRLRRSLLL